MNKKPIKNSTMPLLYVLYWRMDIDYGWLMQSIFFDGLELSEDLSAIQDQIPPPKMFTQLKA
jgi:hypothetical protein